MIKKIQKYLLLHCPVIWNVRFLPAILLLIILHLLFLGIGFWSTDNSFRSNYHYSMGSDFTLLYPVSILICLLFLIGWLYLYSRNNGFKNLYPIKSRQLYLEWIMILIISIGITTIPLTLSQGSSLKWKSVASKQETEKALEILNKVNLLIPSNEYDYQYNSSVDKPIPIPNGMDPKMLLDLNLFSLERNQDSFLIKGYTAPSLLFFHDYQCLEYIEYGDESYENHYDQIQTVKNWLRYLQKDSLYRLMNEFHTLQNKHLLPGTLTPEKWIEYIYHPPFYPVNSFNTISKEIDEYYKDYYRSAIPESSLYYVIDHYSSDTIIIGNEAESRRLVEESSAYLSFNKLFYGYKKINHHYENAESLSLFLLICLSLALWLSTFIFSFRITNGRNWLIAFVSAGLLCFVSVLLTTIIDTFGHNETPFIFLGLFWLVFFIYFCYNIIIRISNRREKGFSSIYVNLTLWIIPCIIPLIVVLYWLWRDAFDYNFSVEYSQGKLLFWINFFLMIPCMYGVCSLLRKWKSLPEK